MVDYSKSKIYKILNSIDDEVYVGSTCCSLSQRLAKHKGDINCRKSKCLLYEHMKQLDKDNFYIELIESFPCQNRDELRAREGHYIRLIGTLNKHVAGRTYKMYYAENKEQMLAHNKEWKSSHQEQMKEYQHKWYEAHKDEQSEQGKQRYADNKETILARNKHYRDNNKDQIHGQKNKLCVCECGLSYSKSHRSRHLQSKKHETHLALQQQKQTHDKHIPM